MFSTVDLILMLLYVVWQFRASKLGTRDYHFGDLFKSVNSIKSKTVSLVMCICCHAAIYNQEAIPRE